MRTSPRPDSVLDVAAFAKADPRGAVNPRQPPHFPPVWADAWGDDRFGLWAEFGVGNVRQRLRWIEPGQFMMGSPDDEHERDGVEGPQHEVRIAAGFWLADSACTQALWVVVTGGANPSRFQDDERCPVERVSWDNVQGFLNRLGEELGPAAEPELPTEAEWEYACRAGTKTPFSFGANVTPWQVNSRSFYPYYGAPGRRDRERTVPVKSLPPNSWGLYEMHGNVSEWCADAMRPYRPASGGRSQLELQTSGGQWPDANRAVRGGSWLFRVGAARSASRLSFRRDGHFNFLGFRFSLKS